jgi:hypothetical protein
VSRYGWKGIFKSIFSEAKRWNLDRAKALQRLQNPATVRPFHQSRVVTAIQIAFWTEM